MTIIESTMTSIKAVATFSINKRIAQKPIDTSNQKIVCKLKSYIKPPIIIYDFLREPKMTKLSLRIP